MRSPRPRTNRHAQALRRERTEAEDRFWYRVRDRRLGGYKFRFQASLGPFVADFLCVDARVVVEIDGSQHGEEVDAARTAWLEAERYLVLRFWNNDVFQRLDAVLEEILRVLRDRAPWVKDT
jgi:very-short-patch-repair endonuclease